MTQIELYKNLKQTKLDEDRKTLVQDIDRLIQEAELLKNQLQAGHVFCADLNHRASKIDQRAVEFQATLGTIGLLEHLMEETA